MKINQTKTEQDINEYFQKEEKKIREEHGFVYREMDNIWSYCRQHKNLLEKCAERMNLLNKKATQVLKKESQE